MIIGVSGVAGAGKDSFFSTLKELLGGKTEVIRFALADKLKEELSDFCIKKYGIDPRSCSREDKEKIRHVMVAYAKEKRHVSSGRYWLEQIEEKIKKFKDSDSLAVITDVRYCDYEKDETHWLKSEMGGLLVHVSRYREDSSGFRHFLPGSNDEELRNEPALYSEADFNIEWPEVPKEGREEMMKNYVNKFIEWQKNLIDKT